MVRFFLFVFLMLPMLGMDAHATELQKSRKKVSATNKVLKGTQKKINTIDDKMVKIMDEYKILGREIDTYKTYNAQLAEMVTSQEGEISGLQRDISGIEETGKRIMPFMKRMIEGLDLFVLSDYPFLMEERRQRIDSLKENMKRADLSIAAKYRQLLEAYQIEIDYGNTIEAYGGELGEKKARFLKIGRIGLYAISLDGSDFQAWHQPSRKWMSISDSSVKQSVLRAMKIAKKQAAPDFFLANVLPAEDRK